MAEFKNRNVFLETDLRDTSPSPFMVLNEQTPAQRKAELAAQRASDRAEEAAKEAEANGFFRVPQMFRRGRSAKNHASLPRQLPGDPPSPREAAALARARSLADSAAEEAAELEEERTGDAWPDPDDLAEALAAAAAAPPDAVVAEAGAASDASERGGANLIAETTRRVSRARGPACAQPRLASR